MAGFSFLGYKKGDLRVSEKLSKTIVSLPMHPYLASKDIDSIVKVLKLKK